MTTPKSDRKMSLGLKLVIYAGVGAGLAVAGWCVCRTWIDWYTIGGDEGEWAIRGTRGDFWGGHLAPMASFFGVLLMFIALLLQKEELRYQREDLALSFKEQQQSRKAAQAQAESLDQHTAELHQQNQVAQFQNDVQFVEFSAQLALDLQVQPTPTKERWETPVSTAMRYICRRAVEDPERALDLVDLFELSLLRRHGFNLTCRPYLVRAAAGFAQLQTIDGAHQCESWINTACRRIDTIGGAL